MHQFLLHNEEIRDTRDSLLSPGQVGFMNGWGVFSTLRVCNGVLFAFDRHYQRMVRDARLLRVPFDLSPEELEQRLLSLVQANNAFNSTLRVAVVRNKGGLFEAPQLRRDSELIAFTADLTDWGEGVNLAYQPFGRFSASPFAGMKVTSWAENLTWYEEAHERGFDEMILLNESGEVSECTSANIFIVREDLVLTPPLATSGCLPGVTRALLLEEICVPDLAIAERDITPSDLEEADQVFIASTTRDLLPVLSVERTPLNQDPAVMRVLRKAFCGYREKYLEARMESVPV
ncbi:MAG: aminotransferase class IV [Acidobacteriaceae bacterium]|nr:aminotransferase class IV [Acidobacteriaceae bacterium]MBV9499298.1 aminotransferase class IV [Acidobacteriaceae bacterium]